MMGDRKKNEKMLVYGLGLTCWRSGSVSGLSVSACLVDGRLSALGSTALASAHVDHVAYPHSAQEREEGNERHQSSKWVVPSKIEQFNQLAGLVHF